MVVHMSGVDVWWEVQVMRVKIAVYEAGIYIHSQAAVHSIIIIGSHECTARRDGHKICLAVVQDI